MTIAPVKVAVAIHKNARALLAGAASNCPFSCFTLEEEATATALYIPHDHVSRQRKQSDLGRVGRRRRRSGKLDGFLTPQMPFGGNRPRPPCTLWRMPPVIRLCGDAPRGTTHRGGRSPRGAGIPAPEGSLCAALLLRNAQNSPNNRHSPVQARNLDCGRRCAIEESGHKTNRAPD